MSEELQELIENIGREYLEAIEEIQYERSAKSIYPDFDHVTEV